MMNDDVCGGGGAEKQQAQVCLHPMNLHLKSIFICSPMVMTGHLKILRLSVETEPGAF